MGNPLMTYLNKRLKDVASSEKHEWGSAGPVITISREVGCNGLKLANQLAESLNELKFNREWRVLSKEIFQKSALELDMEMDKVKKIFKQSDKYAFEEILNAFRNKQYKSERKIVNTVIDIVRSFAIDGYAIIVGRAGHIIANDVKRALHVRLTAPLDYRVSIIMENNNLNREEAIRFIERVEKERIAFRKAIRQESLHEELFDLTINRISFTNEQTIELLKMAIDKKGILKSSRTKAAAF